MPLNATTYQIIFTGVQSLIVVLIAIDRWVHSVNGPTPLSARIDKIEDEVSKISCVELDVRELQAELRANKDMVSSLDRRVSAVEQGHR